MRYRPPTARRLRKQKGASLPQHVPGAGEEGEGGGVTFSFDGLSAPEHAAGKWCVSLRGTSPEERGKLVQGCMVWLDIAIVCRFSLVCFSLVWFSLVCFLYFCLSSGERGG